MAFAGELDAPVDVEAEVPTAAIDDDGVTCVGEGEGATDGDDAVCVHGVASGGCTDAGDGEGDVDLGDATDADEGGGVVASVNVTSTAVEDVDAIVDKGDYRDMGGAIVFVSEEELIAAGRHQQNLKRQPLNDPNSVGVGAAAGASGAMVDHSCSGDIIALVAATTVSTATASPPVAIAPDCVAAAGPTTMDTTASVPMASPPNAKRPRIINLPMPKAPTATPAIVADVALVGDASTPTPTTVLQSPTAGPSSGTAARTDAAMAAQRRLTEHMAAAAAKHAAAVQKHEAMVAREQELKQENKRIAQNKRDNELIVSDFPCEACLTRCGWNVNCAVC